MPKMNGDGDVNELQEAIDTDDTETIEELLNSDKELSARLIHCGKLKSEQSFIFGYSDVGVSCLHYAAYTGS